MNQPLDARSIPLLSPALQIRVVGGKVVAESDDCEYTFEGAGVTRLEALQHRLDGSVSLAELERAGQAPASEVIALLAPLAADGLVLDARPVLEAANPEVFLDGFRRLCDFWSAGWKGTSFWQKMRAGTASPATVLGWGIEFHHYVESANDHMAAAVAHCRHDQVTRRWLARHYVEEHGHGADFLEGLAGCGLDPAEVQAAVPLPGTAALINHLTEVATADTIAYAGMFAAMRDRERPTLAEVDAFYDSLAGHYPFARPLLDRIRAHAKEDLVLDHHELVIERILRQRIRLNPDIAARILRAAGALNECFVLFFEGIDRYYGQPDAVLPRRAVDIRSFLT